MTTLDEDESFKIDLKWSLEGLGDLKAGDKATIILPVEIEGVNNSYELYDENGHLVVNLTQVGNQLTFVFTEFVEQNNNVHGDFTFGQNLVKTLPSIRSINSILKQLMELRQFLYLFEGLRILEQVHYLRNKGFI